ncbi:MAG TPA: FAD-binding oxidoreductase, partial [Chloroflexota bacterium]|nr:FAD-binding oxidoreductase [Chloroflexota bacterium]
VLGAVMNALPLCVVRPRTTQEVSQALAYLYKHHVPVVPYGGGSGVMGGAIPSPGGVMLDVGPLNRILALDEANLAVTAQSGIVLGTLEAWLNERGYIGGHYPQSIDVAHLGGLLATRSAGQFSTMYGNIEDLVLGLEAVLPDGEVVRIPDVPRRSAGPDLRHVWLGSEGAFGVITEVTLKIFPRPEERWIGAYAVPSMRAGLSMIQAIVRPGWRPAVVRLYDEIETQRGFTDATEQGEAILLLLCEGPAGQAECEGQAIDRIARATPGVRALGPAPVHAWLAHRNDVREFYRYVGMGVLVDTIEVAAKWTVVADLYERTLAELKARVPELMVASAHSSHSYQQGTNLYFVIAAQPPRDPAAAERVYWSIWSCVMETVLSHGGTISHHHGIGRVRARWMKAELGSAYPLLTRLKAALDPRQLMNPGTLLPNPGESPAEGHSE